MQRKLFHQQIFDDMPPVGSTSSLSEQLSLYPKNASTVFRVR